MVPGLGMKALIGRIASPVAPLAAAVEVAAAATVVGAGVAMARRNKAPQNSC